MRIVLVGAGALGNEVFKTLGMLGVGGVLVVDPDLIESSNLSRSLFYRGTSCTRKADALCEAGGRFFPDTQWNSAPLAIADIGYAQLREYHLVLGCVDNDLARLEMSLIARKLAIPYVDGGLGGQDYWRGRVSVFLVNSACFACKLTPARRRLLLQTCNATHRACWVSESKPALPSTPTMAAITAALQVDMGLRVICSELPSADPGHSFNIEVAIEPTPKMHTFSMSPSASCPFHTASTVQLQSASADSQLPEDLLRSHNGARIELDWPICVRARCYTCQNQWRPMKRTAWLREYGVCPHCRSRRFLELENIRTIEYGSEWARVPLSSLGFPPRHLYSIA